MRLVTLNDPINGNYIYIAFEKNEETYIKTLRTRLLTIFETAITQTDEKRNKKYFVFELPEFNTDGNEYYGSLEWIFYEIKEVFALTPENILDNKLNSMKSTQTTALEVSFQIALKTVQHNPHAFDEKLAASTTSAQKSAQTVHSRAIASGYQTTTMLLQQLTSASATSGSIPADDTTAANSAQPPIKKPPMSLLSMAIAKLKDDKSDSSLTKPILEPRDNINTKDNFEASDKAEKTEQPPEADPNTSINSDSPNQKDKSENYRCPCAIL